MLNPYIIIAVLLAIISAGGGGFLYGGRVQKALDDQAQLKAVQTAVDDANKQASADKAVAIKQASLDAAARTRQAFIRSQANDEFRKDPLPVNCNWGVPAFRLLIESVAAANGDKTTPDSLPASVRRANSPGK